MLLFFDSLIINYLIYKLRNCLKVMFNFTIYLEVKNNIYSFIIICFKLIKNIVDILKFNFLIFFFFLNLLVLEPKLDSSISPDI